jgi:hypothetical protein
MDVICGVNGELWTPERPLYVCHHCGMPVCERDGVVVGADDAFDPSDGAGRAAMHCPSCADEYHRRAAKRQGWPDPKLVQAGAAAAVRPRPPAHGQQPYYGQPPYGQQAQGRAAGGQ